MSSPRRRLLAVRDARVFLTGQAFSSFGDSALWLATAVWVKALTHSSGAAGLVIFFYMAPAVLAPASGLLVDRCRRRPLMIAVNALVGLAVLLLLLVHGVHQLWLIYLVMAVYGLAHSILGAAQSALLTTLLAPELLADANGALRTINGTLTLVAPLAGAALYAAVGAHAVVALDAATFVAPVVSLLALRHTEPPPVPRTGRWRAELAAGARHLLRTPELRRVTVAASVAVLGFGFSETIVFAVADVGLHRPASFVGVLVAIQGAGAILGGPTAAPLLRRIGEQALIALGLSLIAVGALLEVVASLPVVIAGVVLIGLSLPWVMVGLITLVQLATPAELQGRVYAAADAIISLPQTLSIAAGAGLVGIVGYRVLLGGMAASSAVAALCLLHRPARRAEPAGVGAPAARAAPGGR